MKKEYKVVMAAGWFDTKTLFVEAESAAEIQKQIESKFAYELEFEGLRIKDIALVG